MVDVGGIVLPFRVVTFLHHQFAQVCVVTHQCAALLAHTSHSMSPWQGWHVVIVVVGTPRRMVWFWL